tara:strand:+ start:501 stop:887 length:387 start_codon:yes stop_codon:yes gene_type:complete
MIFDLHENKIEELDIKLSKRHINLDPSGYFIIRIDQVGQKIIVEHYKNNINSTGIAVDPITNVPIECNGKGTNSVNKIFSGRTAKEVGIAITESKFNLISKFDHALYLGRELQKAELCLLKNISYTQD